MRLFSIPYSAVSSLTYKMGISLRNGQLLLAMAHLRSALFKITTFKEDVGLSGTSCMICYHASLVLNYHPDIKVLINMGNEENWLFGCCTGYVWYSKMCI